MELPAHSRFCLQCGAPIAAGLPSPKAVDQDERRQLTVMFCDLAESTGLSERLDPEDLLDVVRRYQGVAAGIVERYGGHVAQYLGDGVLVYFGYPRAYEDDARRAVMSGLEIARAISRLSKTLEMDKGVALAVRIGLHTGSVVAGEVGAGARTEQLAMGATPNVAARVQSLAAPGDVLLTEDSFRLVERFFECSCLGPRELRGISEPIVLYRAVQRRSDELLTDRVSDEYPTPFVGRERELRTLLERLERAEAGEGQVVVLSGEPGIGKTRLQQELRRRTENRTAAWLSCRCSAYHQNSALYPIVEQLERTLGLKPGDEAEESLAKLETWLESLELPVAELAPPLAALLSLPTERYQVDAPNPERQRRQFLSVLIRLVRHLARSHPVVLSMEDLQWADPSTRELLGMLAPEIEHEKVLAIFACRPEEVAAWSSLPRATRLELRRLDQEDAEALLDGWVELPPALRREVLARTDGIPLFLEELTRAVVAGGLGRENGARRSAPGDPAPLIPSTLRNSLMARLDGLGPAKETAQLGSLLGRSFHHEILEAVSPVEPRLLKQHLERLVDSGLLQLVGSAPHATYTFRHSLMQDTAYESMLRSRRRQLHDHVARVLTEAFPALLRSEPETLARHCEAAGRRREAMDFQRAAGVRALQGGAYVEAIVSFRKALGLLAELEEGRDRDRQELDLLHLLVVPIFAHRGYAAPELPDIYAGIRELTRSLGGAREQAWQLVTSWGFHLVRGDRRETLALADEIVAFAKHSSGLFSDAELGYVLGSTAFFAGDQAQALAGLERATQPSEGGVDSPLASVGYAFLAPLVRGWALAVTGHPEQAWRTLSASLALAESTGQPFGIAQALSYMAAVAQDLGRDPHEVREIAERLLTIASEQELKIWICFAHIFRGWARAMLGEDDGVAEMREAIEASLAGGHRTSMGHSLLMLTAALQHLGRTEEALATAEETLGFCARHLESFSEADAHRLKGELLWLQGEREAAESSLRTALLTACKQQARLFALRAATSLARLMQEQGRSREGRECLAPLVTDFTEGLDGPWLRQAKALLDRLEAPHASVAAGR
jgi:class 3 adenylate cyclase/tetratricopeptide (TPR) repeat protein